MNTLQIHLEERATAKRVPQDKRKAAKITFKTFDPFINQNDTKKTPTGSRNKRHNRQDQHSNLNKQRFL